MVPWLVCTPWHANSLIFFGIVTGIPLNLISYSLEFSEFNVFRWLFRILPASLARLFLAQFRFVLE